MDVSVRIFIQCNVHVIICFNTCSKEALSKSPQNENVSRACTSERMYVDKRRPDKHTPKRVLVAKTFDFVATIWSQYLQRNLTDLRYVYLQTI